MSKITKNPLKITFNGSLAFVKGVEPPTCRLGGDRSILLSYTNIERILLYQTQARKTRKNTKIILVLILGLLLTIIKHKILCLYDRMYTIFCNVWWTGLPLRRRPLYPTELHERNGVGDKAQQIALSVNDRYRNEISLSKLLLL